MLKTIPRMTTTPEREKIPAGLPQGLVIFAWYLVIKVVIIEHHQGLAPLISKAWWEILASRGLLILMMAALIPLQLRREGLETADLGYKSQWTLRDLAWGIGAGAIIWFIHNGLLDWAAKSVGTEWANTGVKSIYADVFRFAGPAEKFGGCLSAAVLTPIIEETVYRAGMITSFRRRWGGGLRREAAYVLASSLLFASAHQLSHPLYTVVYAFTGAGLALLYVKTRSLNATIAAHSVINVIFHYRAFY